MLIYQFLGRKAHGRGGSCHPLLLLDPLRFSYQPLVPRPPAHFFTVNNSFVSAVPPSSQDPASLEQSSSLLAYALRTFGLLLIKMMVIIYLAFSTMLSASHILLHLILPYKVDIIILPFYK